MSYITEASYKGSIPAAVEVVVATAGANSRTVLRAGVVRNPSPGNATATLTVLRDAVVIKQVALAAGESVELTDVLVVDALGTFSLQLSGAPVTPWTYFFSGAVIGS